MHIPILSDVTSFIAMGLVMTSYFVKNKKGYLLFQFLGIIFLILSYFFSIEFVAMIGLTIGLIRTLVYFLYESKDKLAPLFWPFIFSALTIASYFVGNELKGTEGSLLDVLCVVSLCLYAFIFRIRDFRIVKLTCLVPTVMAIIYNALIGVTFSALSYSFEFCANIVAIVLYYRNFNREKILGFDKKEEKDEQN